MTAIFLSRPPGLTMADVQIVTFPPADGPAGSVVGPIVVRALDAAGAPAPGAAIGWEIVSGGGELVEPRTPGPGRRS